MPIEIASRSWETADESRRRRVMTGQGFLVASTSFEAAGISFERGISRIAHGHELLTHPDIRRRFVPCESPAGRALIRSGRTPWRLQSRRGDRPGWHLAVEEVR